MYVLIGLNFFTFTCIHCVHIISLTVLRLQC